MKTLLFGASGQLGQDIIMRAPPTAEVAAVSHDECEIGDFHSVRNCVAKYNPQRVINCAAWTDVPGCEIDDRRAFESNALGARHIAKTAAEFGAPVLYVSTDYVFDGKKGSPYEENDQPTPINTYGLTKLMGEYYTMAANERFFVVRTSGVYGRHLCRGKKTNFVDTMLRLSKERDTLKVVDDEILSPTYSSDLADQIWKLIETDRYGIYHASNIGQCSWYQFASEIFRLAGLSTKLDKTTVLDFGSPVRRPANSALANRALEQENLNIMRPWQDALADYLQQKNN